MQHTTAEKANGRAVSRQVISVYPQTFYNHLIQNVPHIAALKPAHQCRIIRILSDQALQERYRHKRGQGIFYPSTTLRKHFGKNYKAITRRVFNVDDSYWHEPGKPEDSFTKTYTIKPEIRNVVNEYLVSREATPDRIIVNGSPYTPRRNAIAKLDNNGMKKQTSAEIAPPVPINVQNLQDVERYLSKLWDNLSHGRSPRTGPFQHLYEAIQERSENFGEELDRTETWLRITGEMLRLSNVKPLPFGYMLHLYQETSTGRLQGQGLHLQHVPSPLRYEALRGQGLYLYDFDNCHYSVLEQLSPHNLPTVNAYNADKTAFRQTIATDLGVTMGQVKKALIAIIYGAVNGEGYTVSDIMGGNASAFLEHPHIAGLYKDVKASRRDIIANAKRSENQHGTYIINTMNKAIPDTEKPATVLSHILQGVESAMLDAILEQHGEAVRLLLFDGFISSEELDPEELQDLVQNNTGFRVKIDGKKLP